MRAFLVALLSISVCSASAPVCAAQQAIPNFSLSGSIGWRTDNATIRNTEVRLTGVPFLLPPSSDPQPVTLDHKIFNEAHPFDFTTMFAVADLTNPNLQPWVVDALRAEKDRRLSGKPIQQPPANRCWPPGVPISVSFPVDPTFFVQSANEVLIINQHANFQVRRVAMNRRHSVNPKPSWTGESIGHYENGNTLVVDTIGLTDRTFLDYFNTPHTAALHVIERWKLDKNGQDMELTVRVEDPGAFRAPYEISQHLRRVEEPWGEYICTENPSDPFHQGLEPLPQSDKPDF